jgi:hypothetical protein
MNDLIYIRGCANLSGQLGNLIWSEVEFNSIKVCRYIEWRILIIDQSIRIERPGKKELNLLHLRTRRRICSFVVHRPNSRKKRAAKRLGHGTYLVDHDHDGRKWPCGGGQIIEEAWKKSQFLGRPGETCTEVAREYILLEANTKCLQPLLGFDSNHLLEINVDGHPSRSEDTFLDAAQKRCLTSLVSTPQTDVFAS